MILLETKMSKLQYCVYVLESQKDQKLYIGSTTNLKQRLTSHFHGDNESTAPRRPFKLIFCEYFFSKQDALRREYYFKTSPGKRALKIMLKNSITRELWDSRTRYQILIFERIDNYRVWFRISRGNVWVIIVLAFCLRQRLYAPWAITRFFKPTRHWPADSHPAKKGDFG